jgi:hypothetical protein
VTHRKTCSFVVYWASVVSRNSWKMHKRQEKNWLPSSQVYIVSLHLCDIICSGHASIRKTWPLETGSSLEST